MSAGDPLAGIEAMSLAELRSAWIERLGEPPPSLRTRELMINALGYRLQAKALGGLAGATKRRLAELDRRYGGDRDYRPVAAPALKPGSSLIKEWRGTRHEVRVLEDGFSYTGERFKSLSEVATRITGTKWNGLVFFGLKERGR